MKSDWFDSTPELERLYVEEKLILDATEAISEALESAKMKRADLARALEVSKTEISQRMSGERNLTLRTLAAMLYAAGAEATIKLQPHCPSDKDRPIDELTTRRIQIVRGGARYQHVPVQNDYSEVSL